MSRTTARLLAMAAVAAAAATFVAVVPAAAAPAKAPSGCGQAAPQAPGTSVRHTVTSGGRERTYELHLPADYNGNRPLPVVVAFHGRGSTGAELEGFSKLSTLPAVVAYPDGVIGTGDGDRQAWQGAPYSAPGVDDVLFTNDLLDRLESTLCIDTRRVYATGKSNGAGFTGILACKAADRITAIAPVAGAFYPTGEPCNPSRPVPVIEFHGTTDATIPYTGDADRGLPAIPDWVGAWAGRDGCRPPLPPVQAKPDITLTLWVLCSGGAAVSHVAVAGGGHTWPGADSYSGGGVTTQSIEAHDVAWQFLRTFQLPKR